MIYRRFNDAISVLLHNPICRGFNHVVDALGGAGGVKDDALRRRYAVLVVTAIEGDGAGDAEAIGPAIGQGTAVGQAESAAAVVAKQLDVVVGHRANREERCCTVRTTVDQHGKRLGVGFIGERIIVVDAVSVDGGQLGESIVCGTRLDLGTS